MISGHGTQKVVPMKFEILWLVLQTRIPLNTYGTTWIGRLEDGQWHATTQQLKQCLQEWQHITRKRYSSSYYVISASTCYGVY